MDYDEGRTLLAETGALLRVQFCRTEDMIRLVMADQLSRDSQKMEQRLTDLFERRMDGHFDRVECLMDRTDQKTGASFTSRFRNSSRTYW